MHCNLRPPDIAFVVLRFNYEARIKFEIGQPLRSWLTIDVKKRSKRIFKNVKNVKKRDKNKKLCKRWIKNVTNDIPLNAYPTWLRPKKRLKHNIRTLQSSLIKSVYFLLLIFYNLHYAVTSIFEPLTLNGWRDRTQCQILAKSKVRGWVIAIWRKNVLSPPWNSR